MKDETRRWLKKSEEDLKTAEILIKNDRFPESAFFLQQAIEKALKSILIEKKSGFPKTHDLVSLGKQAGIQKDFLEYLKEISPAYTYTRYPDVIESGELEDKIDQFLKHTKEVLEWIRTKI